MRLKIKVTKDILRKAMWCGTDKDKGFIIYNCAIAVAVRDIFHEASASVDNLTVYGVRNGHFNYTEIPWLNVMTVRDFMREFDQSTPEDRPFLDEFECEVELPESVINSINISDIHKSATLEVVS